MNFKELIQSNIEKSGFHVTIVVGAIEPRFAYSIGLYSKFNFELVFPGGIFYLKDQVLRIFNAIVKSIEESGGLLKDNIAVDDLGEFSFAPVDSSWAKMMLLGVFDYYKNAEIRAYQIVPDSNHFTLDTPDLSKEFKQSEEPTWQWLNREWDLKVPEQSTAVTNLDALRGAPITELMRWEEGEWEMFAGPGPEVAEEDFRVVSLGTILGIDKTLLPSIDLEVGTGLRRDDGDSAWRSWGKR